MDEDLETGRVSSQLEQSHDADDAEELEEVVLSIEPRQQEVEVERHGRHEVDHVDGRAEKAQDVRADGEAYDQLEGEPSVAGALDVEEWKILIGGSLVQKPAWAGATAVRRSPGGDVKDNRHSQVGMCLEAEDCDGNEDEENRQC